LPRHGASVMLPGLFALVVLFCLLLELLGLVALLVLLLVLLVLLVLLSAFRLGTFVFDAGALVSWATARRGLVPGRLLLRVEWRPSACLGS
jgi:hypothetical protein